MRRLEREKGFEPSTLALARRCSTTELFPLKKQTEERWILLSVLLAVKQPDAWLERVMHVTAISQRYEKVTSPESILSH